MYKLITSSGDNCVLSIGFDRDCGVRQRELTSNKNIKGKYRVGNYLKDIFGFAEHQEKATFGLGCRLTLTTNSDNAVLNKGNAINNGKTKINSIDWYVLHFTQSLEQQNITLNQIVRKLATKFHYPERRVFIKEINAQKFVVFSIRNTRRY